jgi:DNA-binding response OmpR family regulator
MESQVTTLIVDDDQAVCFFLEELLSAEGHAVVTAPDGEEALERLRDIHFDLAILDLQLGGRVDGLRVLEAISWRWPNMARIILTGHGTLDSAISAIDEGVDAYLLKPVKAQDLRRLVKAALEKRSHDSQVRQATGAAASLQRGPIVVDLSRHEVSRDEQTLTLNPCEYKLLVHLMENDDRPVSVKELVSVVKGYQCEHVHEARDVIKWYVYSLRQKVERDPSAPRHLLNVRGVGYIFKA